MAPQFTTGPPNEPPNERSHHDPCTRVLRPQKLRGCPVTLRAGETLRFAPTDCFSNQPPAAKEPPMTNATRYPFIAAQQPYDETRLSAHLRRIQPFTPQVRNALHR